jgi:rhodanese-related sulfurtransferase
MNRIRNIGSPCPAFGVLATDGLTVVAPLAQVIAMKKLKISSADMVAAARARIREVETVDLIAMLDDPDVVIVDIRDVREGGKGHIPGSVHAPRGMVEFWVDPDSPYFKPVFGQDKKYVFHCASGWRSALTVATLQDMGFEASHLREGFSAWADAGGPVDVPDAKV